ncbi:arylsulfatase [Pelagicoccus enzymogenes]|uniref:arylsulfatase n=1 Tax=Pelagicoccus enzymogenes TaxID=2773457 RepID=UPI00280F580F|nr:arylsulfatase [Pelagicoccus enzymogenes]MDQ8199580.1 arylsulfatase [Pelagicoccus enzymogenes]
MSFLKNLLTVFALSCLCFGSSLWAEERPNIVFVLVDDMGYSDLGCYGGEIQTPNIDRLAERGVRFSQMYNTAKCFPSRACLLTGIYAQQSGMDKKHGEMKNAVTLGEVLREAGYRTLASGKHHGTENLYDRGFDHYYGLRDGCCNFWNPGERRPGEPEPGRKRARHWCIDEQTFYPYTPEDPDFYATDAFTDRALEWLEEPETQQKPFFLYLAYTAPHYPLHAWPEDIAKYKGVYDEGYHVIQRRRYQRQVEMGLVDPETTPFTQEPKPGAWETLSGDERAKEAQRMEIYAAMLDRVDQNIGRLVDKLQAHGRLENTIIMFASDNGGCAEGTGAVVFSEDPNDAGTLASYDTVGENWAIVQNTPFRFYKNYSHEGGICTPFIVSWPDGIKEKGAMNDQVSHFIDIMPTLVEIGETTYPKSYYGEKIVPMQGVSLLPAFSGGKVARPEPLFWQWKQGGAVRLGDMKAVKWGPQWELYDLSKDRNETENLAASHADELSGLVARWEQWMASFDPEE